MTREEHSATQHKVMNLQIPQWIADIPPHQPVLIAGPTASGKSALALHIAQSKGGVIINADALQVYSNWRILTARPTQKEESRAVHALYGHVDGQTHYSVGQWLRDIIPFITGDMRPIIVGGTGLYFSALTQGLVDIPAISKDVQDLCAQRWETEGITALAGELDDTTRARIDLQNPMRVMRAWQVWRHTGKSLIDWQNETPPPLLNLNTCSAIVFSTSTEWLNARIARRFKQMVECGALDEARENFDNFSRSSPSGKAIGAAELISHLQGTLTLQEAIEQANIATRQYAKRQRTWFRSNMQKWQIFDPSLS